MITTEFVRRDVASAVGAARVPTATDAMAQKLQRVFESRSRALRMVRSAAGARRDLSSDVYERLAAKVLEIRGLGGAGSEVLALLSALDADEVKLVDNDREAKWHALLVATMANLVVTNEALTDMATTMAKQLVGEPGKLISGSEIAEMLGLSEESVRLRHRDGKLIAILSAGRERGRGFPIFQAWDGIAGAPLEQILAALGYDGRGGLDAAEAFQFFTSRNELLGEFTPVEVLTGAGVAPADDAQAAEFLAKPHEERLEFVSQVARTVAQQAREQ